MSDQEEEYPRRMGRVMVFMAWVLVLVLLALIFQPLLERQYNPNRAVDLVVTSDGVREVVLKRNRAGHYIATGTINDTAIVFLIDTGATQVALSPRLASLLNLRKGRRLKVRTASGVADAWSTSLDKVALGSIELANVPATIVPGMGANEVLLGMSFLKQLEMIQRGNTLTLRQR